MFTTISTLPAQCRVLASGMTNPQRTTLDHNIYTTVGVSLALDGRDCDAVPFFDRNTSAITPPGLKNNVENALAIRALYKANSTEELLASKWLKGWARNNQPAAQVATVYSDMNKLSLTAANACYVIEAGVDFCTMCAEYNLPIPEADRETKPMDSIAREANLKDFTHIMTRWALL